MKENKTKNSHISYLELKKISSWGIFSMKMKKNSISDQRLENCEKIEGAIHDGIYVGSPGKDIYYMLPYLNKEQMEEIAVIIKNIFPKTPPKSYGNISAFIRFIYGQFEKQGVLRSEEDFERMKKEKLDWELSREFIWYLFEELRKDNNYYGLSMIYEMEGHRYGDEAVINNDEKKLELMKQNYFLCIEFAKKCNSWKHLFSIDYWCGEYLFKFGEKEEAVKYYKKSIKNADKYYYKYFPNGDQYYKQRLYKSLLKTKEENSNFYKKYKKIKVFKGDF